MSHKKHKYKQRGEFKRVDPVKLRKLSYDELWPCPGPRVEDKLKGVIKERISRREWLTLMYGITLAEEQAK